MRLSARTGNAPASLSGGRPEGCRVVKMTLASGTEFKDVPLPCCVTLFTLCASLSPFPGCQMEEWVVLVQLSLGVVSLGGDGENIPSELAERSGWGRDTPQSGA